MSNLEKYSQAFVDAFEIEDTGTVSKLEYNSIDEWDSIGHMGLIAELEDAFDIAMETDDIIEFSSFEKGKELMAKYGVTV